jgi:hypothetical protein
MGAVAPNTFLTSHLVRTRVATGLLVSIVIVGTFDGIAQRLAAVPALENTGAWEAQKCSLDPSEVRLLH